MNEQNEIIKSKLAAIYCRVSTEDQAKKGMSIDAQEMICREAAIKDGFSVIEVIKDEGKSGGNMFRPGIKRLQQLAEERAINAVFVIHGDRLARNTEGHIALMKLFDANKIQVRAILQATFDRGTADGLMTDTMMAVFAEHFRNTISEKTLSSMEVKAKEGWFPSTPPIGYITIKKNEQYEGDASKHIIIPDPRTASLMQECFSLYSTGNYNVTELQEILYEKGLRTKKHGTKVSLTVLYSSLRNRFYIGELNWRDIHREGKHEPLIDKATFERVQKVLAAHNQFANRTRKHWFLLRGLVMCDEHRTHRYTAEYHKKKSNLEFSYYHCSNNSGCPGGCVETSMLESEVAALFNQFKFSDSFIERVVSKAKAKFDAANKDHGNRMKTLLGHQTRLLRKRKASEEKLFKGVLSDEDFTRIRQEIIKELSDIKSELDRLENKREVKLDIAQEVLLLARDVPAAYKKVPPRVKQYYHQIFFKQLFAYKGQITEVVYTELFEELVKLQCLIREKPAENKDTLILRQSLGA